MKRLHVHVRVKDMEESVGFYSVMFDTEPNVLKDDYAKWMLDDPRVNFAISTGRGKVGVDHLGVQVDSDEELGEYSEKLEAAGRNVVEQEGAICCYAKSDKAWVSDPQGVAWETFFSLGSEAVYGGDRVPRSALVVEGDADSGMLEDDTCCVPKDVECCDDATAQAADCCDGVESGKAA